MRGVASGPSHATQGTSEETVGRVHDHTRQGKGEVDSLVIMHSASPVRKREVHTERSTHARSAAPHLADTKTREHIHTFIQRGTSAVPHSRTQRVTHVFT